MGKQNEDKLYVGVDVDDVVADYLTGLQSYASKKLLRHVPRPLSWQFANEWGLSARELRVMMDEFVQEGQLEKLEPIRNAIDTIDQIRKMGHAICIITARGHDGSLDNALNTYSMIQTLRWLNTFHVHYDQIHFTAEKASVAVDVMIDDGTHHLTAMERVGIVPVCFARPHNTSWQGLRPSSWLEVEILFRNAEIRKRVIHAIDEGLRGDNIPLLPEGVTAAGA